MYVYGTLAANGGAAGAQIIARADVGHAPAPEETVHIAVKPNSLHFFDVEDGTRIS